MSYLENLSDEQLREYLSSTAGEVYVVTTPYEVGRNLVSNCFYEIRAYHPLDGSEITLRYAEGCVPICACGECRLICKELSEFYSMVEALRWVRQNLPTASINLCKAAYDSLPLELILRTILRGEGCKFCSSITGELYHLLETLDVEVWSVRRHEKHDILPRSGWTGRKSK